MVDNAQSERDWIASLLKTLSNSFRNPDGCGKSHPERCRQLMAELCDCLCEEVERRAQQANTDH